MPQPIKTENRTRQPIRVKTSAQGEGIYARQAGSLGYYGHIIMQVEPCEREGLVFDWTVTEAAIPERFSQAVLRGIQLTCDEDGVYDGYAFTQTRVRVVDGSYAEGDSNERAYERASSLAFEEAIKKAGVLANDA